MTKIETLECLVAHAKEVKYRGIVSGKITRTIVKRYCKENCDNSKLCDELLSTCNTSSFTGKDFGWKKSE